MKLTHFFLAILVVLELNNQWNAVECWESYEMDLFDLVEDINQNFYEFFGLSSSVNSKSLVYFSFSFPKIFCN